MILPIYVYGDPILRQETTPVEYDSEDLQELIDNMIETMHGAAGIGLAAPQVGRSERLFVVDLTPFMSDPDGTNLDGAYPDDGTLADTTPDDSTLADTTPDDSTLVDTTPSDTIPISNGRQGTVDSDDPGTPDGADGSLSSSDSYPDASYEGDEDELADLPDQPMVFINAIIDLESEEECDYEEGCLSIPDLRETVVRPDGVRIRYQDRHLKSRELVATGMLARVIQHEYDHLEGILFIDHISSFRRRLLQRRLREMSRGNVEADYPLAGIPEASSDD